MNILVIGNGFDLAHGLPTKYGDFLEFARVIKNIDELNILNNLEKIDAKLCENQKINSEIRFMIPKKFGADLLEESEKELLRLVENNFWIDYFLQNPMYQKENWIDFESEISRIIRNIDDDMRERDFYGQINELPTEYLDYYYLHKGFKINKLGDWEGIHEITYQGLRNSLLKDLNRLIRAFEIYLCEYVENIEHNGILLDIQEICVRKILSFNYTNTYKKIYDPEELLEYDYVHGRIDSKHSIYTNNMVLGIDEYLSEDRKDKDVEFIAFKKFYQRICKKTGCKYKDWIDQIKNKYHQYLENRNYYVEMIKYAERNGDDLRALKWSAETETLDKYDEGNQISNLYIFGHSLDVTDKDIFRNLIINDNVYTTIFYFSKDDLATKVTNLVKLIGQDELIKRTSGCAKTIEFKLQQGLVDRGINISERD